MTKIESLAKACKDLMLKEPFYGLFLIALNKKWDERIPTAGVCLRNINIELLINSTFWESLSPPHQMGLLKHELLHIAFFHLTESYSHLEDPKLANIAMDIEINQYIDKAMLPAGGQLPECYPHLDLDLKAGSIYYYNKLLEKKKEGDPFIQALLDAMAKNKDMAELPDGNIVQVPKHVWDELQKLDETTQKLVKSQVAHILNQVAEQVKSSAGNIPGEMETLLKNLNNSEPPKFDWRGYIRRFRGKSVKTYTKQSRRKFNKRMPELSGLKIKQRNHILVGIDTSGSVNMEELREFMQEIRHMYKTGSEVTVVQCDTAISNISKFRPADEFTIHGRGGTDFQPVIDYYNENQNKYSCLIYLTDGECSAPENAKGNILWVHSSISNINQDLPGFKIQLN